MGNITSHSANNTTEITNFQNVNIPDNYTMIKTVTYNVQLKNSISMRAHINKIIHYIFGMFRGKGIDIICIQGLEDKYSLYELVSSIKKVSAKKDLTLYFAPEFDDIEISEKASLQSSFQITWSGSKPQSANFENDTTSIIVSKYPIISHLCEPLDTIDTSLFIIDRIVVSNINIQGSIISLYNVSLSNDIASAQINNYEKRVSELDKVRDVIVSNQISVAVDERFKEYIQTNINLMVGSFEIPEIKNGEINTEYLELTDKFHCSDIYRYQHGDYGGYTTIKQERIDYIMFLLTEDIFDTNNIYHTMILKVKKPSDILKIIFKRYNLHTIQTYVNIEEDYRPHYPVENVLIFKTSF